jgi:hypothetical protein
MNLKTNKMELTKLAYKLAKQHGYKYSRASEYTLLSYSDRLKIGAYIMFLLEQER